MQPRKLGLTPLGSSWLQTESTWKIPSRWSSLSLMQLEERPRKEWMEPHSYYLARRLGKLRWPEVEIWKPCSFSSAGKKLGIVLCWTCLYLPVTPLVLGRIGVRYLYQSALGNNSRG